MKTDDREQQRQAAIAEHARATEPIIAELRALGFEVATLDELRRSGKNYSRAVPVLINWLPKVQGLDVKESIIRTLSVPWAKGVATRVVLDEFYKSPTEAMNFRWAVGNAMEVIADEAVAGELLEIVANPSNGMARQMFVMALGKIGSSASIPVLLGLLRQEEVAGHAVDALGRLQAVEATEELQRLAAHGKPWVRKAAAKALARIAKAAS
ncbi:MAG: HEAT repeat domain-containing protein [Bryobacter sp.]|nr:HEAT repeat domain-containing protein [Bryobacter sp. CoA8 C33]